MREKIMNHQRIFMPLILILFVVACGGGGGQSGDGAQSGDGGSAPVSYDGLTTQASLSTVSTKEIFSAIWNGESLSGSSLSGSSFIGTVSSENVSSFNALKNSGLLSPFRHAKNRSMFDLTNFSAGLTGASNEIQLGSYAAPVSQTRNGSVSGTVTMTGSLDTITYTGTLTITYDNFNDGLGYTYDGIVNLKIDGYNVSNDVITDGTASFTLWTIRSANRNLSLNGSMRTQENLQNNTEIITCNMDSRNNTNNTTIRFLNFVVTSVYTNILNPTSKTENVNGRVYVAEYGYVEVNTTSPFIYASASQECPGSGGPLVLTGKNNSKSEITAYSTNYIAIKVDADGDGVYEFRNVHAWNNLTGAPVEIAPIANAGADQTAMMNSLVTLNGSASTDLNGHTLTYSWTITSKPNGSAATLTNSLTTNAAFTPDLAGVYFISLVVGNGTNSSSPDTVTINVTKEIKPLNFLVIDAEYSKQLNKIIMISATPANQLHIYDPVSNQDIAVNLNLAPNCVSVSPDGQFAAVGHNAWISYVNLLTGTLVSTIPVTADVFDIVLAGNGYIYAFPRVDQWINIHCIKITDGTETLSTGSSLRAGSRAKLHPLGTTIYTADNGLSPSSLFKYDVSGGNATYLYKCPFHGTYAINGNLWIAEDGQRIFTESGNVFKSSSNQADDMTYRGKLPNLDSVTSMTHSISAGKVAVIPTTAYYVVAGGDDTQLQWYNSDYLTFESSETIPGHGKFVFYNSAGTKVYVVMQANSITGSAYGYGMVTY